MLSSNHGCRGNALCCRRLSGACVNWIKFCWRCCFIIGEYIPQNCLLSISSSILINNLWKTTFGFSFLFNFILASAVAETLSTVYWNLLQQKRRADMPTPTDLKPSFGLHLRRYSRSVLWCFSSYSLCLLLLLCTWTRASKLRVFHCQKYYKICSQSWHPALLSWDEFFCCCLCQHCLFIFSEWYFGVSDALRRSFIQLWSTSDIHIAQFTIPAFEVNSDKRESWKQENMWFAIF